MGAEVVDMWRAGYVVLTLADGCPRCRVYAQQHGAGEPRLLFSQRQAGARIVWSDWRESEDEALRVDAVMFPLETGCRLDWWYGRCFRPSTPSEITYASAEHADLPPYLAPFAVTRQQANKNPPVMLLADLVDLIQDKGAKAEEKPPASTTADKSGSGATGG